LTNWPAQSVFVSGLARDHSVSPSLCRRVRRSPSRCRLGRKCDFGRRPTCPAAAREPTHCDDPTRCGVTASMAATSIPVSAVKSVVDQRSEP
jgi:hypothetical protein